MKPNTITWLFLFIISLAIEMIGFNVGSIRRDLHEIRTEMERTNRLAELRKVEHEMENIKDDGIRFKNMKVRP